MGVGLERANTAPRLRELLNSWCFALPFRFFTLAGGARGGQPSPLVIFLLPFPAPGRKRVISWP